MTTTLTPYLSFNGNTREAFAFYAQALGASIQTMLRYADMPVPVSSAAPSEGCGDGSAPPSGDGIMHACLAPPGMPYDAFKGVMVALQFDTVAEADSAFQALSQGGKVTMPMMPAFWAKSFGMLTDRFGLSWAVNGVPIEIKS